MVAKKRGTVVRQSAKSDGEVGKDTFDHPDFDRLLLSLSENPSEFLDGYLAWLWSAQVQKLMEKNGPIGGKQPARPIDDSPQVIWQPQVFEHVRAEPFSNRKDKEVPMGHVDMQIVVDRWRPAYGYAKDGKTKQWAEPEEMEAARINVVCRPELSSIAGTMRRLQDLNQRQQSFHNRVQEFQAVLTTKPQYKDVFHAQGFWYLHIP